MANPDVAVLLHREAGEGDHAKRGGGGVRQTLRNNRTRKYIVTELPHPFAVPKSTAKQTLAPANQTA
jgi:hypothetical protein